MAEKFAKILHRVPWGIIAGVCGVIVFYTIIGTIASHSILSSIAAATTDTAGLFDTWYQSLLFVCDIIFGIGFVAGLTLFILSKVRKEDKEATN